jgi:hypothetical protein
MSLPRPNPDEKPPGVPAKPEPAEPPGPAVLGESSYDRVTSMLLAVILGAGISLAWLWLIYSTNQAYQARVTAPLEIVEVSGGGGGTPEGQVGNVETIQVAGGAESDRPSNNEEEAGDFEQPSLEATPAAMLDTVAEAGQNLSEIDISEVMPSGGKIASGRRASKIGNSTVGGYGFGPGDGGVSRGERWTIVANPGQTADEYARQLDFLGIELGIPSGKQMVYVSRFSQAVPNKRVGTGIGDNRFYALWHGQGRKAADVALLRKAGIEAADVIIQFFPPEVEANLAQLEVRFKGRQPAEIRRTQFRIIGRGDSYGFEVVSQEPLR